MDDAAVLSGTSSTLTSPPSLAKLASGPPVEYSIANVGGENLTAKRVA